MQFGDSWSMSFNTIVNSSAFSSYLKKMNECADVAIRYINDAMEHNVAPVGYIDMMTHDHFRTVGVGVMGLAEALMSFHIPYGSADAERFAATTMGEIALTCWEGSFKLAKDGRKKPLGWNAERMVAIYRERLKNAVKYGCPQSHLDRWNSLIKRTQAGEYATNTCVTSVAPTGTISMIAGWTMTRAIGADTPVTISGGLEPPFDWGIKRTDSAGKDITYHDLWHTDEHRGKPWMITANKLSAVEHVRMQAAVCAFTCMSVSKTINMPNDASIEDVEHAYRLSWKMGIPGTTVYRDRSKPMQVLSALECPSGECGVDYSSLLDSSQTLTFADATAK
jgi:ribonucleoside-diphosphate reductase alpha chain